MNNFISGLLACLMCVVFSAQESYAAWITDYKGTLGGKNIGLSITTENQNYAVDYSNIVEIHYFYTQYLQDIPLQLKSKQGRYISLEEYDRQGKLVGTFNLTFAIQDPQKHFSSKEDLNAEVLVGTWDRADGKENYPVYLIIDDMVSGDGKGGRCNLDGQGYSRLQEKVKRFHTAAVNGDVKILEEEFSFSLPESPEWRAEIAKAVPHDLFCNYQGYMLGSGIMWFDGDGNIIN
ncbi:hypothetical protein [Oleomonas cavernae]|uniref:hypothetical protein n=1 Tax=Oleomonas cavernae TaxID=2320859 RepID=UPI0011C42E85|nr:hypothetical protein [Oleomonas cavernae]